MKYEEIFRSNIWRGTYKERSPKCIGTLHDGWEISDERLHCKLLPPWDENEIQYRCSFFNTPSQCVAKISPQVTKFAHNYNCTLLTWVDVFRGSCFGAEI